MLIGGFCLRFKMGTKQDFIRELELEFARSEERVKIMDEELEELKIRMKKTNKELEKLI